MGDFSCLTVRLQRSDDGSMGFATQDDPRHRERSCGTRDRSACLFSLYRILLRQMPEYIIPGEAA
jgi:hypothetical protein